MLNEIQNGARAELVDILNSLHTPANFRVTLDVLEDTEELNLQVLKRDPKAYKLFGKIFWTSKSQWTVQRRLTSRSYVGLLAQLRERSEFLEFELIFEGTLEYHTACDL